MSKSKRQRNVIGVMCAYQEVARIETALRSMTALGCTRLVVVDGRWDGFPTYGSDSSTDGTQRMAKKCGAEIIEAPAGGWPNEIAARNAYLVGKPGDWYFIMDADEVVSGTLPNLDAGPQAFLARHSEPDGQIYQRIRLLQESGDLVYQFTHWSIYRNRRLVEEATLTEAFSITHNGRPDDDDRNRRRAEWLAVSESNEKAFVRMGRAPAIYVETPAHIGYKYVGNGEWIRGIPAKDIFEYDVPRYEQDIEANARITGRRLYERQLPPTAKPPQNLATPSAPHITEHEAGAPQEAD
jgi:glycosyltransferase involved in cell wall biosynthesis